MYRHVQMVSIFMIVQGILQVFMGLFLVAMGPALFAMMKLAPPGTASGSPPPPDAFIGVAGAIYVIMGAPTVISGGLMIWAAIRNLKFKGRTLGIVALVSGAVSMLSCYCLPTAIALMVFGLIVYVNEQTAKAFEFGEQGMTTEQVHAAMTDLVQGKQPPPQAYPPSDWPDYGKGNGPA